MADSFPTISADQLTKAAAGVLSALDGDTVCSSWSGKDLSLEVTQTDNTQPKQTLQSSLELLESLSTSVTSDLAKLGSLDLQKPNKCSLPLSNINTGRVKKCDGSTQSVTKKYSSRKNYKLLPPLPFTQPQASQRKSVPQAVGQKQVLTLSHCANVHSAEKLKSMPVRLARYTTKYFFIGAAAPVQAVATVETLTSNDVLKTAPCNNSLRLSSVPVTSTTTTASKVIISNPSLVPIAPKLLPNNTRMTAVVLSSTGKSAIHSPVLGPLLPLPLAITSSLPSKTAQQKGSFGVSAGGGFMATTQLSQTVASTPSTQPPSPGAKFVTCAELKADCVLRPDAPTLPPTTSQNLHPPASSVKHELNTLSSPIHSSNTNTINSAARGLSQVKLSPSSYQPSSSPSRSPNVTAPNASHKFIVQPSNLRVLLQGKPLPNYPSPVQHSSNLSTPSSVLPGLRFKSNGDLPCAASPVTCSESKLFELAPKATVTTSNKCTEASKIENQSLSSKVFTRPSLTDTSFTAMSDPTLCNPAYKLVMSNTNLLPSLQSHTNVPKSQEKTLNKSDNPPSTSTVLKHTSIDHQLDHIKESLFNLLKSSMGNTPTCSPNIAASNQTLVTPSHSIGVVLCSKGKHLQKNSITSAPMPSDTICKNTSGSQSDNLLKSLLSCNEAQQQKAGLSYFRSCNGDLTASLVRSYGDGRPQASPSLTGLNVSSPSTDNISQEEESISLSTAAAAAAMVSLSETNTPLSKLSESSHPTNVVSSSGLQIASPHGMDSTPQFLISHEDRTKLVISPAGIRHLQNLLRRQGISEGYFVITTPRASVSVASNAKTNSSDPAKSDSQIKKDQQTENSVSSFLNTFPSISASGEKVEELATPSKNLVDNVENGITSPMSHDGQTASSKVDDLCQGSYESESDSSSESRSSCGALVIETEDDDRHSISMTSETSDCSAGKHLTESSDNIFQTFHCKTLEPEKDSKLEESAWGSSNDPNCNGMIAQSPLSLSDLIRQQQRHGDFNFLSTPEHKIKPNGDVMSSDTENGQQMPVVSSGEDFTFTMPLCPASTYCASHQHSSNVEMSSGYQHSMYGSNPMFSGDMSFEPGTQGSILEPHQGLAELPTNPSPKLLSRPMSVSSPKSPLSVNSSQIPDHSVPLNPPMTPNTILINLLNRVPTPLLTNHQDLLSVPTSQESNLNETTLGNFEIIQSKQGNSIYNGKTVSYANTSDQNTSLLNSTETGNTDLMFNNGAQNDSSNTYRSYASDPNVSHEHNFNIVNFSQCTIQNPNMPLCYTETYNDSTKTGDDCQHFHCKSCPGPLIVTVNLDTNSPETTVRVSHACNAAKSTEDLLNSFAQGTLGLQKTDRSSEQSEMQLNLIPVKSSETDILRHLILNTSSSSFHTISPGVHRFGNTPPSYGMSQESQFQCQVESFLNHGSEHKDLTYQPQEENFLHMDTLSHSQSASTFKTMKPSYAASSYQASGSYDNTTNRSFSEEDNSTLVNSGSSSYILQSNVPSFGMNDMSKSSMPMDDQPFLESTERLQHLSEFRSDEQQETLFYQHSQHSHDSQSDLHRQQSLHLYDPAHQHQGHDLDYHLESLPQTHNLHEYSTSISHSGSSRIFDDHAEENVCFLDNQLPPQYYDNSRMSTNVTMYSQLCTVASDAPVLGTSATHSCNIPFSTAPTGLQLEFRFPPDDEDNDTHIEKQPVLPSASFSPPSVADPAITPDPGGLGMYNGTFPNLSVYDMYVRGSNSDGRCGDCDIAPEFGNFCVDCNIMYKTQCKFHPSEYSYVCDTPILSHARLTLPPCLRLDTSSIVGHTNNTGVFAKEAIPIRTKFGPLIGSSASCDQLGSTRSFSLWQMFSESSTKVVDTSDENSSNWLMFVKPARLSSEQNLVAFQHGSNVYFVTRVDIIPGQELRYWFAKDYARLLGITPNPKNVFYQLCPHCTVCKQIFPDRKQVRSHTTLQHPKPRTKKCGQCSRRFSQVSHLNAHITSVHLKVKKCVCPHCNKRFSDSSNFRKHVKAHSGERHFKCQICGKDFRQKAHLTHHMNTHMPVKNEECGFCGDRFTRAFTRKQHELQHTQQNKIQCQHCDKVFYKNQVYKQHLKIHSNERNYVCQLCNKAFRTKANLTRHGPACKQKKNIIPLQSLSSQPATAPGSSVPGIC